MKSIAIGLSLLPIQNPAIYTPRTNRSIDNQIALASKDRTVIDYFLQMPDRYFKILDRVASPSGNRDRVTPTIRRKLLKKSGATIDINNGYLAVSSLVPDLCGYELAIFKRSRGSHLVAVNIDCAPGDRLRIVDPDRSWQDVTATIFPAGILAPDTNQTIKLPRQGRTIAIFDANSRPIASIKFENDRFKLVK